ncbi:Uncharacterised protein [Pseudomonas putida]|nr:Uncharacterised protein [Pseudomonas putida]
MYIRSTFLDGIYYSIIDKANNRSFFIFATTYYCIAFTLTFFNKVNIKL